MIAIQFKGANAILGADQDQYEPLPVFRKGDTVSCCFRLSDAEIAEIIETRTIWHTQLVLDRPFQPVSMSCQKPEGLP